MKQQTLTGFEKYGKTTRRAKFLADTDRIIPWPEMTAALRPGQAALWLCQGRSKRRIAVKGGPSWAFF